MIHQDIFATATNILYQEYLANATIAAPVGDPQHVFRLSEGPPKFQYAVQPDGSVPFIGSNYTSRTASWWDPNMRMPYVLNWSGGVQWEFAHNWVSKGSIRAVRRGRDQQLDMNAIPLNISTDTNTLNQIFQNAQNFKPYRQFGSINLYSNFGHNTYHGGTGAWRSAPRRG